MGQEEWSQRQSNLIQLRILLHTPTDFAFGPLSTLHFLRTYDFKVAVELLPNSDELQAFFEIFKKIEGVSNHQVAPIGRYSERVIASYYTFISVKFLILFALVTFITQDEHKRH